MIILTRIRASRGLRAVSGISEGLRRQFKIVWRDNRFPDRRSAACPTRYQLWHLPSSLHGRWTSSVFVLLVHLSSHSQKCSFRSNRPCCETMARCMCHMDNRYSSGDYSMVRGAHWDRPSRSGLGHMAEGHKRERIQANSSCRQQNLRMNVDVNLEVAIHCDMIEDPRSKVQQPSCWVSNRMSAC